MTSVVGKTPREARVKAVVGRKQGLGETSILLDVLGHSDSPLSVAAGAATYEPMLQARYQNTSVGSNPDKQPAWKSQQEFDHVILERQRDLAPHGDSTEYDFDLQWDPVTTGSRFGFDGETPDLSSRAVVMRRLHAIEQISENAFLTSRGAVHQDLENRYLSGNAKEDGSHRGAKSPEEASGPEDSPMRVPIGLTLVSPMGAPYFVSLPQNRPLLPANKVILSYVPPGGRYAFRPIWHDNRFVYSIGAGTRPFVRAQQDSLHEIGLNAGTEPLLSAAHQPAVQGPASGIIQALSTVSQEDGNHAQGLSGALPSIAVDGAEGSAAHRVRGAALPTGQRGRRLQYGRHFFASGSSREAAVAAQEPHGKLHWEGKREEPYAHLRIVSQPQRALKLQTKGESSRHVVRRLEGLDHIPGCWEVRLSFWEQLSSSDSLESPLDLPQTADLRNNTSVRLIWHVNAVVGRNRNAS